MTRGGHLLVLMAVGMLAAACAPITGDDSPPPGAAEGGAGSEVVRLRVAPPARDGPPYVRDQWQPHGWADADGDGCNTREEVLLAESQRPVQRRAPGCRILSGDWLDPYTGLRTASPGDLQIDHLVALADAHRSGGWSWPSSKKVSFANDLGDPDLLNAVSGQENERKSDDGPDQWMPPNRGYRCSYVSAYARIKARWGLTVTAGQHEAIVRVLKGCPSEPG